jgi:hypothetical protein
MTNKTRGIVLALSLVSLVGWFLSIGWLWLGPQIGASAFIVRDLWKTIRDGD